MLNMYRSRENSIMNPSHLPITCFQKLPTMANPNEVFCKGYENGAIGRLVLLLWKKGFFSVKRVIELFWSDHVLSTNCARYFANVI